MRIHDDRPDSAGGYPDDQYHRDVREPQGGWTVPEREQVSTRTYGGSTGTGSVELDYYDDDAYTDVGDPASQRDLDLYDEFADSVNRRRWNGGADFALLVLRLALGVVFITRGARKLFGVLGGQGPEGTADMLSDMGFREPQLLATVTGGVEFGAGILLLLGLFTPLAAAGLLGVMLNAVVVQRSSGFFLEDGGVEYPALLGVVALALLFAGPGRVAADNGRFWFRRPVASGFVGLLLAVAAAAVVFFVFR
ncbi:putative oxidoreductase [Actinopolyspora lacussalsi subsp. righensis]|uniref:Putative oxidoreductase n=1 Tax=Actinopolyspora righensis TaxID=995060 RepID=A0A1I7C6Q4_9ACTN|nr:DoxX family protein [Actinopolyspora righensis]SFT95121.1 putative oxidoreductase [Actinopolyspora righensis]